MGNDGNRNPKKKQRTFRKYSLKKRPPNSNLHIWELFCESVDKALDSDLPFFLVGDLKF
jgi:hypothetical protein